MKFWLLPLFMLMCGCSSMDVGDYATTEPALDLRRFFDGELRAYGMLQDRSGRMTRRFTATLSGRWNGDIGMLEEHFSFDDGEEQDRTWTLQHLGDGHYRGIAGDVIGTAEGRSSGSVFSWHYQLDVPWGDGSIAVNLDDWLYLIDNEHLLNRTVLRKFGFRVGELTLVIEKI